MEEVEQQGGAHLNEVCKPTRFRLNLPVDDTDPQGPRANRTLKTTGCHRHAKFLVPLLPDAYFDEVDLLNNSMIADLQKDGSTEYRASADEDFDFQDGDHNQTTMSDGTPAPAKVCAVDDAMGLWPRFQHAMYTGESFQEP